NCSTGALNKKERTVPVVAEEIRGVKTTCPYCGAGCQLILKIKGKTLLEVTADPEQAPNFGALCVKGRFGQNFIQHPDRLKTPLIRRNNRLVECSWNEALEFIAKSLFDLKAMFGPDSIAAFSSARCTNEDNFLTQKFMRAVIGTNNVDHCARL
ncbi:MAG: molybdopterin-dependent oxidoreductase, partial [Desulfobulbaceae bacterium]|nr:molybdopterin-dependent oxidoreductase [Desulfobulbaceae bacterium]